jgi:hypothetical protein
MADSEDDHGVPLEIEDHPVRANPVAAGPDPGIRQLARRLKRCGAVLAELLEEVLSFTGGSSRFKSWRARRVRRTSAIEEVLEGRHPAFEMINPSLFN